MKRYTYETTATYMAPESYEHYFSGMVEEGWRLVSVVKERKDLFKCYWEKEVAE